MPNSNMILNIDDWRNALDAVCRWKPFEWGDKIIGNRSLGGGLTKKQCEDCG